MLSIAHAATGALIATKITSPLVSIPLILASHYLEDYLLHWDFGTGLSKGIKKPSTALAQEISLDMTITILFIYIFFQAGSSEINLYAWGGAFISLIPDFLEAPKNFLKWEPSWLEPVSKFHKNFHNSTPNMIAGLTPQLVLLFVIALAA